MDETKFDPGRLCASGVDRMRLGSFDALDKQEAADADLVRAIFGFSAHFFAACLSRQAGALFGSDAEI